MKIARELERRLERLVDGISATVFGGKMHPVDLANRLVRHADLQVTEGALGPEIPNVYRVAVHPEDLAPGVRRGEAAQLLAEVLEEAATDRGWRTGGPIVVDLVTDPKVAPGTIRADAEHRPGPRPPWSHLIEASGAAVYALADNRVLIGRSPTADVTIADAEVSRRHALIHREAGRIWLRDLGSANGTWLNAERVGDTPQPLAPGDQVSFGPVTLTFRLV